MNILETERLIIRPFTMDDLEDVHHVLDVDLEWAGAGVTLEQRREKLQLEIALANWQLTGCLYGNRAIVLKETRELIGLCGFRPWIITPAERALYDPAGMTQDHPFNMPELGVGYALASKHQGQGYATEAVNALIRYALQGLRVRRVVALTARGNETSVNLMKRVGMRIGINPDPQAIYPGAVGIIENSAAQEMAEYG
jgi:ribosomal-protein-alanine N-acetyltransferase